MSERKSTIREAPPHTETTAGGAFGWSLANTLVSRLGTLGIGIVLARVLGPGEFGTFAIALVALMAVLSFNELGVSLAIVRWPTDPSLIFPTVNMLSTAGSVVFCVLGWLAAPRFTHLMGDSGATDVVRLLIFSVLLNGIVAAPAALLQRTFQERTRMGIDQVNVWSGAVISVALALLGMGAMALAVGRLVGSALSAVMFLRASPMPYRFGWDRSRAMSLAKFGLPLAGASIVMFAVGYADQLVAGSILGAAALGFYVLAFNLSSWPLNIVSQPLRRVAPAVFAAIQHDPERSHHAVRGLLGILASAAFPAFLALAGAAGPLVRLVYGEPWIPAAKVLSWLVVAALSKVFYELVYDYLVVAGRTGTVMMIQLAGLVVLVPALWFGATVAGLVGLAAAQAAVAFVVLMPMYLWQLRRAGIGLGSMLGMLWLPAISGLVVGMVCYLCARLIPIPLLALSAGALFSLLVMAGLLYLRRGDIRSLLQISRHESIEATP
ncbi:oligosaccharide flippase family protein [Paeniglutamicibacter sp. NPDC012692]|uniref:oligosaccharide flippase family protein n=1 Tax=Paeniglutamicibacter sp. NPDC012692 TaxID=3364388 RepID=UPI0036BB7301